MVNDDGPPSSRLSPYIRPFVEALQDAGHLVSVAIPASSRSWIGKAHIIEAPLTATYVPPAAFRDDGTWDPNYPSSSSSTTTTTTNGDADSDSGRENEWVVITNGTQTRAWQKTENGLIELDKLPDWNRIQ